MKAGSSAVLASTLLLAMASLARAQQPAPNPVPRTPAAPAALSIPDPFAALQPGARDLYQSPDRSDRFHHLATYPAPPANISGVSVPGPYSIGPYYLAVAPAYHSAVTRVVAARGGLALETLPDAAQVYVDGFYVGLARDFGLRGRPLDLPEGAHHVELRAPGYERLGFSVTIKPNETLRYRGDLQALPLTTPPRAAQQAAVQKIVYVIPNCYAGDRPPTGALPPGCDLKKLQTR